MKHKAEFILGLLGGVLGILSGILIMKTDLFEVVASNKEEALLIGMFVILCSVFAIITSLFIEHKPKKSWLDASSFWGFRITHFIGSLCCSIRLITRCRDFGSY